MEKLYPVLIDIFNTLKNKYFIFDRDSFKEGDTITMNYRLGLRYNVTSQPIGLEDMFIYKVELKEGDRKEELCPGMFFDICNIKEGTFN